MLFAMGLSLNILSVARLGKFVDTPKPLKVCFLSEKEAVLV